MKFSLLLASFISLSTMATTIVDVEGLNQSQLIEKGTKIGKCVVEKSELVRAYGNGAVTGMQLSLALDGQIYSALLDSKLTYTETAEGKVVESVIDSTTGGTGMFGTEKKTQQKVMIVYKDISPGEESVVKVSIEKKIEGLLGMKKDKRNSVVCK